MFLAKNQMLKKTNTPIQHLIKNKMHTHIRVINTTIDGKTVYDR